MSRLTLPSGGISGPITLAMLDPTLVTYIDNSDFDRLPKSWMVAQRQGADLSNATTVMQAISGLDFNAGAGTTWALEYTIGTGHDGTEGVAFQLVAPAGADIQLGILGSGSAQSALEFSYVGNGVSPAYNRGNFYNGQCRIKVALVCPTAGTVSLRFATASGTNAAKVYSRSSVVGSRVS